MLVWAAGKKDVPQNVSMGMGRGMEKRKGAVVETQPLCAFKDGWMLASENASQRRTH